MISNIRDFINFFRQIQFTIKVKLGLIPAFLQVRLLRNQNIITNRYNSLEVLHQGKLNSSLAIVAIYPENTFLYSLSLENLIQGLIQSRATPIVVSNGELPTALLKMLISKKITILRRRNYGRDFAAYKYGFLWVTKNYEIKKINSLFFVNDTLNWPKSSSYIIDKTKGAQWGGIYLNLADRTHVNSFFMKFDSSVINCKSFINFWNNYLPSQYKRHAIHKGEIKLSTDLLRAGFLPEVIVNADFIIESVKKLKRDSLIALHSLPNVELGPSLNHFFAPKDKLLAMNEIVFKKSLSIPNLQSDVLDRLLRILYKDSPHSLGLHLYIMEEFPTKRDLYKYFPLGEIAGALSVHSENYSDLIIEDFEKTMTRRMIALRKQKIMRFLGES